MEFLPVFSFGGQNTEHGDPLFVGQQNGSSSISSQLANRISSWQQQLLITQTTAAAAAASACLPGVQLGVAIANYKVSQVSLFGGQLYLSGREVEQLGGAIRNYKVSHHHLPAPTHA